MFTTKDKLFADRLGYNITDQSSFISRDTQSQVNAGVELKPRPSPAPERDPVWREKAESTSFPPATSCESLEWNTWEDE